jgi:hypothetical protein
MAGYKAAPLFFMARALIQVTVFVVLGALGGDFEG